MRTMPDPPNPQFNNKYYQGPFDPMMVSPTMDMRERREDILTPSPKMERVSNKNSEFHYSNYPPNQHG